MEDLSNEPGEHNPWHDNAEAQKRAHFDKASALLQQNLLKDHIKAPKSQWVKALIYLDGKQFNFAGRDYLKPIYNGFYPRKLLKFARQSEKSTFLANDMIVNCAVTPYTKSIYVAPSHTQVRQYSNGKLRPWSQDSPILKKYYLSTGVSDQVFEKGFTNGSMMFLRSAFLNADRVRGLTGTELYIDELQHILSSNISVILEVLSHAPNPQVTYSGTPLTNDNPIETYWNLSSQCEWLVPCDRHTPLHWNYLDTRCIGKHGPICNKCGGRIDPAKGKWFSLSSNRNVMGFHISQLMVPWMQSPAKWDELLFKYETYSVGQFANECLGVSYDNASKPVTRTDLVACCSSKHPFRKHPDPYTNSLVVSAGIDWGEGVDGSERGIKGRLKNASYTVLTLGAYVTPKIFHVFFMKRYVGEEAAPSNCVRDITQICTAFGVKCFGVDWGHGWGVNEQLEKAFDRPKEKKVIKFQYLGMQRERKKYDPIGVKYQLNRTDVMTDFFEDIKSQKFLFPDWETMQPFLEDAEHVHTEHASTGMLKYDHRSSEPDDSVHSIILCREASDNYYGRSR
jgi:Phage terminase large subunit (GpA)